MKQQRWHPSCKLTLIILLAVGKVLATDQLSALAQVVRDGTLGAESSTFSPASINGVPSVVIQGGATRGSNLFHSFQEFNVEAGRGVYFENPTGIENILSRVTGNNSSKIFGKLGVLGDANLFLMNPNGIIFGSGASLDLRGSFVATTASEMVFDNGYKFSTIDPQAPPLLTVNIPLGLNFRQNAGRVSVEELGSLNVSPGKTLALIGGDIEINGGFLQAPGGRIELGGLAEAGTVGLIFNGNNLVFSFPQSGQRADVTLTNEATVNVDGEGGGSIQVQGDLITLTDAANITSITLGSQTGGEVSLRANQLIIKDGAVVFTLTLGSGKGGNLTITASDFVEVSGKSATGNVAGLATFTAAAGDAGNLSISTGRLIVRDGARLASNTFASAQNVFNYGGTGNAGNIVIAAKQVIVKGSQISNGTFGKGRAGNLNVTASDSIELIGILENGRTASGLFAGSNDGAEGDGGSITIQTRRLSTRDGAQVVTSTHGSGNGGNLIVRAAEVELSGTSVDGNISSGLFTDTSEGFAARAGDLRIETDKLIVRDRAIISTGTSGAGSGGNLTIKTGKLIAQNGGVILTSTFSDGKAGNLTITASEFIEVSGISADGETNSLITTQTFSGGAAGDLSIKTGQLTVKDGGRITSRSIGKGTAGNIEITARKVRLENQSIINAEAASQNGGNIKLKVRDLILLRRGGEISTTAGTARGPGNGGNIDIDTNFLVAIPDENSDITANSFGGRGGAINITAQGIFGLEVRNQLTPKSDITAFSQLSPALNGEITLNLPIVDPSQGLLELPQTVIDPAALIAQNPCARGEGSNFVVTGRGGLPSNPAQTFSGEAVEVNLIEPVLSNHLGQKVPTNQSGSPKVHRSQTSQTILPAQGWVMDNAGQVLLTAYNPTRDLLSRSCPAR